MAVPRPCVGSHSQKAIAARSSRAVEVRASFFQGLRSRLGMGVFNYQCSLKKFLRPAIFIPESKNIEELLQQMKRAKFHLAVVVDEYGGASSIDVVDGDDGDAGMIASSVDVADGDANDD